MFIIVFIHSVHSLGLETTEILVPATSYVYTIPTLCFMFGWPYVHLLTIQTIGCVPMERTHTCTNTNTVNGEGGGYDVLGHTQYT